MKLLGELRIFPVSFKVGKTNIAFDICTNLMKDELTNAILSWVHRTKLHNCKSLCHYISSKQWYYGGELICITDKDYDALAIENKEKTIRQLKENP